MTQAELRKIGVTRPDIILVSGDAYVDHPSFAAALLGRALWDAGFSTTIVAQPDWKDKEANDFARFGKPRLFFAVVPGAVDPMVNAFTPALKRRSEDSYSPGGKLTRPERTTIVYTNILHSLYPEIPVVIGGIEASLRRFAHYDYWSDAVRQSILADAPASLLVYGMGELALIKIAKKCSAGIPVSEIRDVPGTCWTMSVGEFRTAPPEDAVVLPVYPLVVNREVYARSFALQYRETTRVIVQPHPKTVIVANPPMRPMTQTELDHLYELPFSRKQHPSYKAQIPALVPVQFSLTTHRGCFGDCSFCAISAHQGQVITSRSEESIIREALRMTKMPEFRGTIQDVGGPSANMYGCTCASWGTTGPCPDKICTRCRRFTRGTEAQLSLLKRLRGMRAVKQVFITSGIRYDMIYRDAPGREYFRLLTIYHSSGHLKVAPEHISEKVTSLMHKPGLTAFEKFRREFEEYQTELPKGRNRQYLLPYLMSSHPGCRIEDMIELALYLREHNMYTEQVQDFTPTPMTLSTAMYYSGVNPLTGVKVHVPVGKEKLIQRAMLQWKDPRQHAYIASGLAKAGRTDLIGDLIPYPRRDAGKKKEK